MEAIPPNKLILRCYGHRVRSGKWVGVCIDLNLAAEAETPEQLRLKMGQVISSYLETVLDTDDQGSIPALFSRKAPLPDIAAYHAIKFANFIRQFRKKIIFEELVPIHLAQNC
jgi:hypothetical protein